MNEIFPTVRIFATADSFYVASSAVNTVLHEALSTPRPYKSPGDERFRKWLHDALAELVRKANATIAKDRGFSYALQVDTVGNVWVTADGGRTQSTLFTSHTDTAHCNHLSNGRQKFRSVDGVLQLDDPAASCLGADDGAGVALMCGMIAVGMEADFVFYVGEERGAVGSTWSVDYEAHRYGNYSRAIAFDRRGRHDVITHQSSGRTCSDTFAAALAGELNRSAGLDYAPSDQGIFTDTDVLASLIPECTNVSVGYEGEHTRSEVLDTVHLAALLRAVMAIDFNNLPTERKPGERDIRWTTYGVETRGFGEEYEQILCYGAEAARDIVYNHPEKAVDMLVELVAASSFDTYYDAWFQAEYDTQPDNP